MRIESGVRCIKPEKGILLVTSNYELVMGGQLELLLIKVLQFWGSAHTREKQARGGVYLRVKCTLDRECKYE
jgi:hypothetical protein